MKFRITFHRIVSWWLAFFALFTILTGYATARRWFINQELITDIHIIIKWSFIFLMLFHVIYTFIFVNFKGTIVKNPKVHWVRLIQQITKWLILGFTILIIVSGFSYYDWTKPLLPFWIVSKIHLLFDIGLTLSIITHLMVGCKIMTKRKRINELWVDILIVSIGIILMISAIIMEILFLTMIFH